MFQEWHSDQAIDGDATLNVGLGPRPAFPGPSDVLHSPFVSMMFL